ncbi:MAG: SDR family oxidoreductase [Cyclobacteriaceae bacterium]
MSSKILITGASSGFGKLTVLALINDGHTVAAAMRGVAGKNKEAAAELSDAGASIVEIDVTNDDSVNTGVSKAIEAMGGLDIVINNAGVGVINMQEHFTIEDFKKVMDVNVYGVQRMNRAALPHLRAQQSGLIIYISSLLGRMVLPFYGPYNASKWALEALAENYRIELAGFGVENAVVEPGGFETNFFGNLIQASDQSRNESYGEFMNAPQQMGEAFGETLANSPDQKPEKVVEAITALVNMQKGQRPFRTVVDHIGMGEPITAFNEHLEGIMKGVYANFQMPEMLGLNKS